MSKQHKAMTRDEALSTILSLMAAHGISLPDIRQAQGAMPSAPHSAEGATGEGDSLIARLFAWLGAVFVFSGIGALVSLIWGDMGSPLRVLVLLGPGIAAMAWVAAMHRRGVAPWYAAPLAGVAALLQPVGLWVTQVEYGWASSAVAAVIILGFMAIQQAWLFCSMQNGVMLFFALLYGLGWFDAVVDLVDFPRQAGCVIAGAMLIALCCRLRMQGWQRICSLYFFVGGIMLLWGVFDVVEGEWTELLYLPVNLLLLYVSTRVGSHALLAVSALGLLAYIGYLTAEHFVDSLGWPLALILLGIAFTAMGMVFMRLRERMSAA